MATFRDDYQDIFGESGNEEVNDFEGYSREELDFNSDIEVEEYSETESEDSESENEDEAMLPADWTKTLTGLNVLSFSVQNPGPTNIIPANRQEIDFFELIFPDKLYEHLVQKNNLYAQQKIAVKPDHRWIPVEKDEMKAFLGLRIYMSIVNLPETRMYWAKDRLFGNFGISHVMTRDRFDKISQYFHANDQSQMSFNAQGKPMDKLYLVRPILDIILNQIQDNYIPYRDVSVDEAMIAYRGHLSFRQYLPAKPTKHGIKVWEACDMRNSFCFDFDVYLGHPMGPGGMEAQESALGKKTVLKLTEKLRDKHYYVYFDNYFTSIELLEELLQRETYSCGTVKSNRKGLPEDLCPAPKSRKEKMQHVLLTHKKIS